MKNTFSILLSLIVCLNLSAQSTLSGRILTSDGQPLEFANVFLFNPTDTSLVKGEITDAEGKYTLTEVRTGDYLISSTMIGYSQIYTPLTIDETTTQAPDLTLFEATTSLDEVTVTAKRPLYEQRIDRLTVNVKNSVTSTGANALEVLSRSPGVRVDGINGQISLAGTPGVIVEINGKRNRMSGDALLQFLKSMPADNIEKIELINTPPASYDAEGVGGIINIILSKNPNEGTQGSYNANIAYGDRLKYGASVNVSTRKGKFTFFTDFSANQNYLQEDVTIDKEVRTDNGIIGTSTFSDRPAFRSAYNGRMGVDYDLTKNTVVGVLVSGYRTDWNLDASTQTTISADGVPFENSNLRSTERNDWNHIMYNFNLRHNFTDKAKFTFDYDYLEYFNTNPTDYFDRVENTQGQTIKENIFISRKENPISFHVWKADYSRPLTEKWNAEIGIKGTFSNFSNDNYLADIINNQEVLNPIYTNLIDMSENVYAAFFSTDYQISKKTSAKAGVRYEYTNLILGNPSETLTSRAYGRFFPSAFLSHNFNDNNSLQISYSERISRPNLNVLAPAFFFFSPNVVTAGNPLVRASFIKQARISYRYKTVSLTLQGSDVDNPMIWGNLDVIADQNLTVSRPTNIDDQKSAMILLNFPLNFTKWWEGSIEGGYGYQQQELRYEGQSIRQANGFAGLFGNQRFKIKGAISLEIDGYMFTPNNNGLARMPMRGSFNIGVRKKFKNNSSLTLNCQDVGNLGSFWQQTYERPDLNLVFNQTYQTEGSVFRLTWSQSFGNTEAKKQEQRGSASQEESGRVQ